MTKELSPTTRSLLEAYYDGSATPEQTAMLAGRPDLPEADRLLIEGVASLATAAPPAGLEARVAMTAGLLAAAERRRRMRMGAAWLCGTVAAAAMLIGVAVKSSGPRSISPHEITDPMEAYSESTRALLMVSDALRDSGTELDAALDSLCDFPADTVEQYPY